MLLPKDDQAIVCPRLRTLLRNALPLLSLRAQALIDSMLTNHGSVGCAQTVAAQLGLRDRFQLARWLVAEGLPPLHELAGWVAVLCWLDCIDRSRVGLCAIALGTGKDPAACYRLVRRLTGQPWGTVRLLGTQWAVDQFAARCRRVSRRWGANRSAELRRRARAVEPQRAAQAVP
jgi:hypothetical protein